MKLHSACLVVVGLLAGCAPAGPESEVHTVAEYMADQQLSAETIEACRASNEAEARVMAEKPACKNVREAEALRFQEGQRAAEKAFQEALRKEVGKPAGEKSGNKGAAW